MITGWSNQSAIGTLVVRASRYVKLVHLPAGHTAADLRAGLTQVVATLPACAWQTLTLDKARRWPFAT